MKKLSIFSWTNKFTKQFGKTERVFYRTNDFFEKFFEKKQSFFHRRDNFIEQTILLRENERNWWKMNNNFKNERNQFFWTVEKHWVVFRTVNEKSQTFPSLHCALWQPLIRVQYPPSDPPPFDKWRTFSNVRNQFISSELCNSVIRLFYIYIFQISLIKVKWRVMTI